MNTLSSPAIVRRARQHASRTAIIDAGRRFSYAELDAASERVAARLLAGAHDVHEARVCFMVPPGFAYVAVQWGIWRAGGIAVPLALSHPAAELKYVIDDADAAIVVADPAYTDILAAIAGERLITTERALQAEPRTLPTIAPDRRAMILYTSGTTGKPKGVVTTHSNIEAQITSLVVAWEWTADDRILLVLPLHHVHGIINVVGCALWSGATCEMMPSFDADKTWERLASGELTLFMAVPTIYHRLIATWRGQQCRGLRLMVSGSAALPVKVLERWREITGHVLLERYGMTEIGMALSNPLHGERRPGYVGMRLPGVEVRLVNGEIEVRGPSVFLEYWRRPDATRAGFTDDGWFRTGDTAVIEAGYYRILGRTSVDIIKTGGYKVSALEIEEVLRTHPSILECAVVGVPDDEWGERVCAAVELRDGDLSLPDLQQWAKQYLAPYKVPRALRIVDQLPRNAMGKVIKPEVATLFS